jgi:hypothetical protein
MALAPPAWQLVPLGPGAGRRVWKVSHGGGSAIRSNHGPQLPNRRNLLCIGEQSYEGGRHLAHGKALKRRVVRQNVRAVGRGAGQPILDD